MAKSISHPQPHFSPTLAAGDFVFVSGQLSSDADNRMVGDGVVEQTRQCLANVEALLAGHDLARGDVVKATVWLRRAEDFWAFNETYAAFFGDHRPARSTVICDLARPEAVVEVEVIAQRRGPEPAPARLPLGPICVAVALGLAAALAAVSFARAEPVAERRAILKDFGAQTPGPMLQGKAPFDLQKVRGALQAYQAGAQRLPALFPPPQAGGPASDALPDIWRNKPDFERRLAQLGADARQAQGAIRDEASFRNEFPKVLANCRGCHDAYRAKK